MDKIRIGTRGSKLALRQAALVQESLGQADSRIETEIVIVHTKGDRIQDKPLSEIGDKGVFASELEQALLEGQIDLAVHSAKDLPAVLADGLTIAATMTRADVRDVLVIPRGGRMPHPSGRDENPVCLCCQPTSNIDDKLFALGSGSRRRQIQADWFWDNMACENIRGNVDTRLCKLKESGYDGIILAKAGLDRLGIDTESSDEFVFCPLSPERFLPAACQGIIAVEAIDGSNVSGICREITDAETELCFLVEREVLLQLAADCSEAIAAWCRPGQDELILDVMYAGNRRKLTCKPEIRAGLAMAAKAAELVKRQ